MEQSHSSPEESPTCYMLLEQVDEETSRLLQILIHPPNTPSPPKERNQRRKAIRRKGSKRNPLKVFQKQFISHPK